MDVRKVLNIVVCFALAILVVPAVALAGKAKPYNVKVTGVGAALTVLPVAGCGSNCLQISLSVEQDTDATGVITTTLELTFFSSTTTIISPGPISIANSNIILGKEGALGVFLTSSDLSGICSGSCQFFSLSFTKNNAYKFRRVGSEHGVCTNGLVLTHIEDTFKQTFEGADANGVIAGAPFFSSAGQLSTLRGDPALETEAGAAPCVLP